MNKQKKEQIVNQCREIMKEYFIDDSVFIFKVEKEEYTYNILVKRNGKLYFEFDSVHCEENNNMNFIQYGFQVH